MKKCLSLILMLCLLTVGAFAETVYQDGVAPQLVGEVAATLVDIGEREDLEDADLAAKLEAALLNLPVNPDAVYTDLFFATIDGEVTMTFQSDAVGVLFSANGTEWADLEAQIGEGTVTVTVKESGVLAFLKDRGEAVAPTATNANAEPETSTNFTPSVSGKLAPEVVGGEDAVATILDATGAEVASVPAAWMVLTPLSARAYNPDVVTFEHLEWAYESVLEGADPLFEGKVVSDLFDLAVYGEYWKQLNVEGNVMKVTFDTELEDGVVVLCSDEIGAWHALENGVTVNADGSVTLTLDHDGVLAFLVEKDDAVEGTVTAP